MSYIMEVMPSCQRTIDKACRKNPLLREILKKKMKEIILNPAHYKPLRHELKGERRVHILKSFVLKFEIDESQKIVTFLAFGHHDESYQRR